MYLVRDRGDQQLYALKCLDKKQIIARNEQGQALNERNIFPFFDSKICRQTEVNN